MIDITIYSRKTVIDGPGTRLILWVHGCPHHCPGCGNRWLWKFHTPTVPVARVIDLIATHREGVEGISLCGGEPFAQAEPLSRVAAAAHAMGLSVVSFSGYTLEELANVPQADLLLAQTDILLDGRYEKGSPEMRRHWVGSTNQRIHYLSDRYAPGLEYPAEGDRARNSHTGPHGRVESLE